MLPLRHERMAVCQRFDAFDKAIESFSVTYADQNDEDYAALERAICGGKLKAVIEEAK